MPETDSAANVDVQRRLLKLTTFDEAIGDIERLRTKGYRQAGNWSLGTTCDHLIKAMEYGLGSEPAKGFSWIMRVTVGKFMLSWVLMRGQMPAGVEAPDIFVPEEQQSDDPAVIDRCVALLKKTDLHDGPTNQSPIFGNMSLRQFKKLQLVHAAHHLSFLIPIE